MVGKQKSIETDSHTHNTIFIVFIESWTIFHKIVVSLHRHSVIVPGGGHKFGSVFALSYS